MSGPRITRMDTKQKKRPAFAGRRSVDTIPGGVNKFKGVFGAGALLPQFLTELTITLNSQLWNYYSITGMSWQACGFSAGSETTATGWRIETGLPTRIP